MASRVIRDFRPLIMAAVITLALVLMSAPAKAHHGADFAVPLAAFIAFGALAHHGHHHYRHYHGHGYHGHGHRPHHRPYRRHSYSHGGYHRPHYKHHRKW